MSGIYIHIPFCAKKCSYCDFYTQVAPGLIDQVVDAIVEEIEIRKEYLIDKHIQTIYFGGGTPSLLNYSQFQKIFQQIAKYYQIDKEAEITFEANPDDLTDSYFSEISPLPFNRISIGIQSFYDDELESIRRRHTGKEAIDAVKRAQNSGFNNLSIDLIYGLPNQSMDRWKANLETGLSLNVQHISAYGLTYEEGTALFQQRKKGIVNEIPDENIIEMYDYLVETLARNNFEQYELSNFSLPNLRSKHNSSYWAGIPYIGIGPSAHSYNLNERQWNISSNRKYVELISNKGVFFEKEILTTTDKYNDYIMVSIRKSDGIDLSQVKQFGQQFLVHFQKEFKKHEIRGELKLQGNKVVLTPKGVHITNRILETLFFV